MTLPDYSRALDLVLEAIAPLPPSIVSFDAAAGLVLAADLIADRDYPPFNRAQMDGYALRSREFQKDRAFQVWGEAPAGRATLSGVPSGECIKIATGAAVPEDLDAVIEHERSDRGNPVTFTVETVEPWRSIHRAGSDARTGALVLPAGTRLTPAHLGIAATIGAISLGVRPRPRVALVTSGDEVIPPNQHPATHQIRNSNGPMLHVALQRFGGVMNAVAHVADDPKVTFETLDRLLTRDSAINLLVTVGGVSAGERDFFPEALERHGVKFVLRGAAIQPGRPVAVGIDRFDRVVLCLPGNPVSALVCAHLFGWPIVRRLGGELAGLPWVEGELSNEAKANALRESFRPCHLRDGRISIPKWSGSGDLLHTAGTHGLAALPVQSEPLTPGARLRFLPWA